MAGQIVERSKGTYTVWVFVGRDAETGKRQYLNKTVRGTKKDAQAVLNKLLREQDLGLLTEPTHQSLNAYLDHWLEVAAKPRLRARTFSEYEKQLARYVRPALGSTKLSKLSPLVIQSLYSAMLGKGSRRAPSGSPTRS